MRDEGYVMNCKEIDREKITGFIATNGGECLVEDVLRESGAEPLRVYPILFEESLAGRIVYVEVGPLGDPVAVRLL